MIEDTHITLARKGFLIYKKEEFSWVMKKIPMPDDSRIIEETPFLTYEAALQEATKLLKSSGTLVNWSVLMRFNRGLGAEHITLSPVEACTHLEAQEIAKKCAEDFCNKTPNMEKAKIIEVRVSPSKTQ